MAKMSRGILEPAVVIPSASSRLCSSSLCQAPLKNTPFGGDGLNSSALYQSRWGIICIQLCPPKAVPSSCLAYG